MSQEMTYLEAVQHATDTYGLVANNEQLSIALFDYAYAQYHSGGYDEIIPAYGELANSLSKLLYVEFSE